MKKYTMIFAASAMLLFAACNKTEDKGYTINGDKITFGIGMDQIRNNDKQNFNGEYKRIYFTSDDQAQINGDVSDVNPRGGSPSVEASVTATVNPNGTYHLFYPLGAYDAITENAGAYTATATFPSEVILLNGAENNHFSNWAAMKPVWPMYEFIDVNDESTYDHLMLNAVSFLAPNVIYGPAWANVVFGPITGIENYNNNTCPMMNVTDVVINSNNLNLTGSATLNYSNPRRPIMVMTGDADNGGTITCHAQSLTNPGERGYAEVVASASTTGSANQEVLNVIGIVPIAPVNNVDDKDLQVTVYFNVTLGSTTYYYKFVSDRKTTDVAFQRNLRNFLQINFQTIGDGGNGQFAYGANATDGFYESITFSGNTGNGVLYRSTTQFPEVL